MGIGTPKTDIYHLLVDISKYFSKARPYNLAKRTALLNRINNAIKELEEL